MKHVYLFILLFVGLYSYGQQISQDSLSQHVHYLASDALEGRALGTKGKDLATRYIAERFQTIGLAPYEGQYLQEFDLKIRLAHVKATNVVGVVHGTDPQLRDEYIVVGAHYDHLGYKEDKTVFSGADDNASGVAAIIELARHFAQDAHRPKRSLIFIAFDAEESGLLGAKHFVDKLSPEGLKSIKAMFSFDMVGMLAANQGLHLKGMGTISDGAAIAQRNAQGLTLLNLSANIERRTDTAPFGDKGVPAIHVFTGAKSPYHKPEDKAHLLDYSGMVQVSSFMARLITDLGSVAVIDPISTMGVEEGKKVAVARPLRFGISGYLGTGRHLYKDEFYDAKTAFAFSVGLQANYFLAANYGFQLEALYDQNASASAEGRFVRHAVLVPLNFQFGNAAYIEAGPYFKHHFDGNNAGEALDFNETYRPQEWGYNFGAGFRSTHLQMGVVHRGAFHSIYQSGAKVIPSAVYFKLGYIF